MRFAHWCVVAGLIVLLSACQPAAATQAPLPGAQDVLNKAASEIRNAKSVKIKLQLSGAPSYVDPPTNAISFVSADGAYASPDRVTAKVVAKILGVAGEVEVIAIGDDQWYSNKILTAGKFINKTFSPGFNAAKLVSSDAGIESALKAIRDLKMIGRETLDGVNVYHVTGAANGADIEALTVGLIRGASVVLDIYVNADNGRVARVVMVQPDTVTAKEPKPTRWDLELFDYNTDIIINPPSVPQAATQAATQIATQPATQSVTAIPTMATAATPTIPLPTDEATQAK